MSTEAKSTVCLLVAAESSPLVLYGLYDVLYSAGAVYPDMTVGQPGPEALDVRIVAAGKAPLRILGNVPVEPHAAIGSVARADVVIACDMYTPIHQPIHGKYPREIAWLKRMHAGGATLCSVCSGSLLLAESGLVDGLDVASHWGYRDLFRRCYPQVRLREEAVLCVSGEGDRIVTAGAVTAWEDLALYLIDRFCGRGTALETAKSFLVTGHSDGQLPCAAMTRLIGESDAVIADCQGWIAESYAEANPVQRMVARSGLTPRTFARRFRASTGYQPIDYVQSLRVEEAKQMLETEAGGIDEIAEAVGYEDVAYFRRLFRRKAGLTPALYRRKFQRIGALASHP